jgi:signal transduction histidine kinase
MSSVAETNLEAHRVTRWPWGGPELVIEPAPQENGDARSESASSYDPAKSIESTVLESFVKNAPWVVFVLIAQATFVLAVLWGLVPDSLLVTWYLLVLLHGYVRRGTCLSYDTDPSKDPRKWILRFVVLAAANGLLWGGFGLVFATFVSLEYQLVILIALLCLAAESITTAVAILPHALIPLFTLTLLPILGYMVLGTYVQRIAALGVALTLALLFRLRHQHYRLLKTQVDLETKQQRLHRELETERRKETDLLRTRTMFLEAVGHDLMQPVHGMALLVRELRRSSGAAAVEALANQLQRGLESVNRYVTTILDTVRLESGTYIPETLELPIQSILDRVVAENSRSARSKGLDLRCHESSAWIRTDPTLAYSIISNFIFNAIRYTNRGRVLVGARRCGATIRIEVWDTGVGIAAAELPKIFRNFYQVRKSRTEGKGMGLALVLRMARLIGCNVTVRSTVGKGSRFAVWLPANQPRMLKTKLMTPQQCFKDKKVVLLDSDASTLERTRSLLVSWGFVITAMTLDDTAMQRGFSPEEPSALLIANISEQAVRSKTSLIESVYHRHRPGKALLVVDEGLDGNAVGRLRAAGFHIFYRPMPPWRLRMILIRLLSAH